MYPIKVAQYGFSIVRSNYALLSIYSLNCYMMYAIRDGWHASVFFQSYVSSMVIFIFGMKETNKSFLKFSSLLRSIEVYFVLLVLGFLSWVLDRFLMKIFYIITPIVFTWVETIETVEYFEIALIFFNAFFVNAFILTICSAIIYNISISSYSEFSGNSLKSSKLKSNFQFAMLLILLNVLFSSFFVYFDLMTGMYITFAIYDALILVSVYSMGKIAYEDYSQRENQIEERVDQQ